MEEDINQKYRVVDVPLDGKIVEVDELIPYKNGNGFFRNVILEINGVFGTPAYVPVALFGMDATELDPELDMNRPLKCAGRLTSRRYLDRNGRMRWALSMSASGVILGARESLQPKSQNEQLADAIKAADPLESDPDDIPF